MTFRECPFVSLYFFNGFRNRWHDLTDLDTAPSHFLPVIRHQQHPPAVATWRNARHQIWMRKDIFGNMQLSSELLLSGRIKSILAFCLMAITKELLYPNQKIWYGPCLHTHRPYVQVTDRPTAYVPCYKLGSLRISEVITYRPKPYVPRYELGPTAYVPCYKLGSVRISEVITYRPKLYVPRYELGLTAYVPCYKLGIVRISEVITYRPKPYVPHYELGPTAYLPC
jgi:hypothetical protein